MSWENLTKNGINNPLWGNFVYPWSLTLPWQYVNPTVIAYSNGTKNATSWFSVLSTEALFQDSDEHLLQDNDNMFLNGIIHGGDITWSNLAK